MLSNSRKFQSRVTWLAAYASLALSLPAAAQSVENFYLDNQVTIIVGLSAGGGYDLNDDIPF